ncbi:MAG: hypothetical protein HS132_02390 [Planctomycetia bacterium]|nr:hypothetical protein [Planctomycetia bacterium]
MEEAPGQTGLHLKMWSHAGVEKLLEIIEELKTKPHEPQPVLSVHT